jgi:phosphoribosylamine--glycine ligase
MRVLIVDRWGGQGLLDFALRCLEDSHKVKWFYPKPPNKDLRFGKGLVEHVSDWTEWMRWADLIFVADNVRYLQMLEPYHKRGFPIVGATVASAAWELDRKLGQDIFRKNGIPVPPYKEFSDYAKAIAFVKKEGRRFVSKPCGDEDDKSLSYCAKSPADMVYMLARWQKMGRHKSSFILQDFIGGIEMAVGCWFGPHGFSSQFCENFEHKKLMAGDTGPATGEQGTVLRYVRQSKLADKVLKPLEDALAATGYCGYIDVNCIIDDEGNPWPLEFTMRPGYPTFNIQQALVKGDRAEWLAQLARGVDTKPWSEEVALGVVYALPPYPYAVEPMEKTIGIPVYGIDDKIRDSVHPCSMMQGRAPADVGGKVVELPVLMTAGDYVLVASGTGPSVRAAKRRAYRVLDQLRAPASPFYRPDIGDRLKTQLPDLQAMGYAKGLEF